MDERLVGLLAFALIAMLLVTAIIGIKRYWDAQLHMSEEDIAFERRVSSLNQDQANRRRDDEIVRLLSGDDERIVGDEERR